MIRKPVIVVDEDVAEIFEDVCREICNDGYLVADVSSEGDWWQAMFVLPEFAAGNLAPALPGLPTQEDLEMFGVGIGMQQWDGITQMFEDRAGLPIEIAWHLGMLLPLLSNEDAATMDVDATTGQVTIQFPTHFTTVFLEIFGEMFEQGSER